MLCDNKEEIKSRKGGDAASSGGSLHSFSSPISIDSSQYGVAFLSNFDAKDNSSRPVITFVVNTVSVLLPSLSGLQKIRYMTIQCIDAAELGCPTKVLSPQNINHLVVCSISKGSRIP